MNVNDNGATVTIHAEHKEHRQTGDIERFVLYTSWLLERGMKIRAFEVRHGEHAQSADVLIATLGRPLVGE